MVQGAQYTQPSLLRRRLIINFRADVLAAASHGQSLGRKRNAQVRAHGHGRVLQTKRFRCVANGALQRRDERHESRHRTRT